ncbi:cupin domain-containing protein [Lysobacter hankyongensis]|uniref:Cupin type-2 domain-containing protein n=1 Tax=Lysobacter hankyongensis TaxID=1176535 RepID=A0ABP9AJY0_9GAMM
MSSHTDGVPQDPPYLRFHPAEAMGHGSVVNEFMLAALAERPGFSGSRFSVEPGARTPVDRHAVAEIWMVAEGAGELDYDGRVVALAAGQVVHFAPFESHSLHNTGATPMMVFSIWWQP